MTLDEAIKHCEEVAQENEKQFNDCPMKYDGAYANNGKTACKCAAEHRQLAEWLKDYKRQTNILSKIKAEMKQIEQLVDQEKFHDEIWALGLKYGTNIIDKCMAENEALEEQEFKITPEEIEKLKKIANEAEKITKETKCSTPKTVDIRSCSYLLPCGMCDKTNQKCNLVDCVI